MKRIFLTRLFLRWMRKTELTEEALRHAVVEIEQGLIDAELGGCIYKKRVALPNRGKRGSTRTILATNLNDRWFFMFGFEKNDKDNISAQELEFIKKYGRSLLSLQEVQILLLLNQRELVEVKNEKTE